MNRQKQREILKRISSYNKFGSVLGMERITELLARIGNPQENLKVIHVAGTNGKGSVCAYLAEVLQSCGYTVGLFTSPYVDEWRERIQINDEYITWDDLEKHAERVFEAAEDFTSNPEVMATVGSPTEFEIVTAIALSYFSEKKPDFVIPEVGLGGRGDSTNVITSPLVSVITSIHHDHMDRLGDSLEKVAWEKAGIIKEGCPVVMNVEHEGAAKVIAREAYAKGAPLTNVRRIEYKADYHAGGVSADFFEGEERFPATTVITANINGVDYREIEITMAGDHQTDNALTALAAIELLRKKGIIKVDLFRLRQGMAAASKLGRFERMGRVILDGAHNPEGMEALARTTDMYFGKMKPVMILGILADKDIDAMLKPALSITDNFILTDVRSERNMQIEPVAKKLKKLGAGVRVCPDNAKALDMAASDSDADYILIAGSFYLISDMRHLIMAGR